MDLSTLNIEGYDIKEHELDGKTVLTQQLHVGHAYFVPGVTPEWRRANNIDHALEFAKADIDSNGKEHAWRYDERNTIAHEYVFHLRNQVKAYQQESLKDGSK